MKNLLFLLIIELSIYSPLSYARGTFEYDTNRNGGDFANFALPQNSPLMCQAACDSSPACVAWTFVKPGVIQANPVCFLKNTIPAASANATTISGLSDRR